MQNNYDFNLGKLIMLYNLALGIAIPIYKLYSDLIMFNYKC